MKKFKKLIPAMCMLLVSAVMLGSSTFAWFSMNNKVTATGMEVTAKANTQYFVISTSGTFNNSTIETAASVTGGINTAEKTVYPVSRIDTDAELIELKRKLANEKYSDNTTVPAVGDWYTANSMTYNTAVSDTLANAHTVDFEAGNYFLVFSFNVSLAEKSSDFNGKLAVSATKAADPEFNAAVKAVIEIEGKTVTGTDVATSKSKEYLTYNIFGETDSKKESDNNYHLAAKNGETAAEYVTIRVYVYVDGSHANVKDEEIAKLKGNFTVYVEGK